MKNERYVFYTSLVINVFNNDRHYNTEIVNVQFGVSTYPLSLPNIDILRYSRYQRAVFALLIVASLEWWDEPKRYLSSLDELISQYSYGDVFICLHTRTHPRPASSGANHKVLLSASKQKLHFPQWYPYTTSFCKVFTGFAGWLFRLLLMWIMVIFRTIHWRKKHVIEKSDHHVVITSLIPHFEWLRVTEDLLQVLGMKVHGILMG